MRNKELIQEIYETCITADYRVTGVIIDLIEKERPELVRYDFWKGGHMALPTFESKMKEMKKYPHQDNHMD